MFNSEKVEQEYHFESAYLQAERERNANRLMDSIFNSPIRKISRKEAIGKQLYRRFDGHYKLV